jgi:Methyltransferase domain
MKSLIKKMLPTGLASKLKPAWRSFRRQRIRWYQRVAGLFGLNLSKTADYYSVLPVLEHLYNNQHRWNKPSKLPGVRYDLDAMKHLLDEAIREFASPVLVAKNYLDSADQGYGPGYPRVDAIVSYCLIRKIKPSRYLEVGSGLSTHFAWLAGKENASEGKPLQIKCIEPYPTDLLRSMQGVDLIVDEVQNVPINQFDFIQSGDVLFIDSTHALRIDSDVAYLFMEIVPRVARGAWVHVHDIPFPYNTPFPADTWVLGDRWPVYWQEAMVLQAFLAHNRAFEIRMSIPLIRHSDEAFIEERIPGYHPLKVDPDPSSAIWLERVE